MSRYQANREAVLCPLKNLEVDFLCCRVNMDSKNLLVYVLQPKILIQKSPVPCGFLDKVLYTISENHSLLLVGNGHLRCALPIYNQITLKTFHPTGKKHTT